MANPPVGQLSAGDAATLADAIAFIVRQHLSQVRTAVPVVVTGLGDDGSSVHVQPLNNQVDGSGNATPHGTVYNIPVHSLSGGNGSVTVTPKVGDMGMIMCADRDISAVKANKKQSNPGSRRQHSMSDAMYMGGFGNINGTPAQSITFGANGIIINGNVIITGALTATGNITAGQGGGDSVTLQNHTHSGGPKPDAGS